MVNPNADQIGRAPYKRKSPAVPQASSGRSMSGYYSAGGSSNLGISSDPLLPNPISMPQYRPIDPDPLLPKPIAIHQYWPMDPATHSYRSDNHLSDGEDSQRNVRSRHNHIVHPEINPSVAYSWNSMPTHFHAAENLSGIDLEGQSSHVHMPMASQARNLSSGSCFNHEGSQCLAGIGVTNATIGHNVVFNPSLTQSRNTSSLHTLNDPITGGMGTGSMGYSQRSNPHRSSSSYALVGNRTALGGDGGAPRMEAIPSSRFSRPLSITGRSSHRNGRTRTSYNRFQSGYDGDAASSRWSSEGAVMIDGAAYDDSRNWFDEHRDMRLDIDNMSYEELLALEERIGNVSTGLSEENISVCLQEITYCSSNQSHDPEEENCAICLEEYKDQDRHGKLSCGHDFHAGCIKNWLLIRNTCPICKAAAAAASTDFRKEKQT